MATSLLALIDDIAGVLGDDLALNAQQVAGVHADRELPVVWAVARGSLRNKVILVPVARAWRSACRSVCWQASPC